MDGQNQTQGTLTTQALLPVVNRIITEPHLKIIYYVIGTLGMIGNSFVIIVIWNYRSMRRGLTNIYIINQSVVDAVVGFFLVILHIFEDDARYFKQGDIADEIYCRVWLSKTLLWSFLVSSTFNLLSLTFERYMAVVHTMWHKTKFTRTKAFCSMTFAWIIGPVYNLSYCIPAAGILDDGTCTVYTQYPSERAQLAVGFITIILQYFLPISLLGYFYIHMAVTLRRSVPPIEGSIRRSRDVHAVAAMRAMRNIIRTLWIVGGCFIFCWTWNQFFFFLFNFHVPAFSDMTTTYYHFTVIMVFCNCCVNPIIYAGNYEQFQRGMAMLFNKCCPGLVQRCCAQKLVNWKSYRDHSQGYSGFRASLAVTISGTINE